MGFNDARALVTADVAIAIGAGTDVAAQAGELVLVRSDPRDVPRIIALSQGNVPEDDPKPLVCSRLQRRRNSLGGRRPCSVGDRAEAVGTVFMPLSTIVVAINAQLLRGLRL